MKKQGLVVFLTAIVATATLLFAADKGPPSAPANADLAKVLRAVIDRNLEGYKEKDIDKVMSAVHPDSPNYEATKTSTKAILGQYTLKIAIVSFTLIGADEDYAVVRVKQTTRKIDGPAFRDNQVDVMHVLRQDKGKWKIWQSAILDAKYLDEPAPATSQPADKKDEL